MFSQRRIALIVPTIAILLLNGCFFSKDTAYEGITFPPTDEVKFTFQEAAIPQTCKVFSHAILNTPPDSSSLDIKNALAEDGKSKGADLIYLGLARAIDDGDEVDDFSIYAYGPLEAYSFHEHWQDWEYAFSYWQTGDEFANFGFDKYKDPEVAYQHSLMIKHVLLRCQTE